MVYGGKARLVVAGLNSRPLLEFMSFSMETDLTLDLSGKTNLLSNRKREEKKPRKWGHRTKGRPRNYTPEHKDRTTLLFGEGRTLYGFPYWQTTPNVLTNSIILSHKISNFSKWFSKFRPILKSLNLFSCCKCYVKIYFIYKSLWIKASPKCINVNIYIF